MKDENGFKPFIPADKVVPEMTGVSIILGILLAVLFGAANAYLGLRVGMTVSASIPAAVISNGSHPCHIKEGFHIGKQYGADHWFCR